MSEQPAIEPNDWQSVQEQYKDWNKNLHPLVEFQLQQHGLTPYEVAEPALDHEVYNPLAAVTEDLHEQSERPVPLDYGKVTESLAAGGFEGWQFNGLVGDLKNMVDVNRGLRREAKDYSDSSYGNVLNALKAAPIDLLRDAYADEGENGQAFRDMLVTNLNSYTDTKIGATLLSDIYDVPDFLALRREPGPQHDDPLVKSLFDGFGFDSKVLKSIQGRHEMMKESDADKADVYIRDKQAEFLTEMLGISEELADTMRFAAMPRLQANDGSGHLDLTKATDFLYDVSSRIQKVGAPTMERLHQELGITNFDYQDDHQLKYLVGLLDNDPATLEHLQSGDTTVVLVDGRGDHNGAMKTTSYQFDTPDKRTIVFEINQPADLYRRMVFLKQRGIKPSTVVAAAHGSPSRMWFGAKGQEFNLSTGLPEADDPAQTFNLSESKGIAKLVEKYMQDGRADGSEDTAGRRRLILKSCSQDNARTVSRKAKDGEGTVEVHESMAETLTKVAGSELLDVFANEHPIYTHRTEKGIMFSADINGKRVEVPARQLKLVNGQLVRSDVAEIQFRKPAGGTA